MIKLGSCEVCGVREQPVTCPSPTYEPVDHRLSTSSHVQLRHTLGRSFCAHAFAVTREGAEILLRLAFPVSSTFDNMLMVLGGGFGPDALRNALSYAGVSSESSLRAWHVDTSTSLFAQADMPVVQSPVGRRLANTSTLPSNGRLLSAEEDDRGLPPTWRKWFRCGSQQQTQHSTPASSVVPQPPLPLLWSSPPAPRPPDQLLSVDKCDALFREPDSILSHMWSLTGWLQIRDGDEGGGPCWGEGEGVNFFNAVIAGQSCRKDWYAGQQPTFTDDAPGLIGYDKSIYRYCRNGGRISQHEHSTDKHAGDRPQDSAEACSKINRNLLTLTSSKYNSCQNLIWLVCAGMGRLPGQRTPTIEFADAPNSLDTSRLGSCGGDHPHGCDRRKAYSNNDILFLEVCTYSKICANADELFSLSEGAPFQCHVREHRIRELQALLVNANAKGNIQAH